MIHDFSGSTRDLPCFVPGAAHIPVFPEESPQIVPVNDGVIDPELVPEIVVFLFDLMELHHLHNFLFAAHCEPVRCPLWRLSSLHFLRWYGKQKMLCRVRFKNSAEHFAHYRIGKQPASHLSLLMGMNNWLKRAAIILLSTQLWRIKKF